MSQALVADKAYELGRAMAAAGMKSLLGQQTPAFVVAPALDRDQGQCRARVGRTRSTAMRRSRCSTLPSDSRARQRRGAAAASQTPSKEN